MRTSRFPTLSQAALWAALCFILLLPGQARAKELRVLAEMTARSVRIENGNLTGWAVEIVQEIMDRSGIRAEIEPTPWARAYSVALARPDVALFPTTRTKERDSLFHWVGPIFRVQWSFLARKGSDIVIRSLDDARRVRSIGTYIKDARDRFLEDHGFTNLERSASEESIYRKLEYGRLDLIVGSNTGLAGIAETTGVDPKKFVEVFPLKEVDLYIALSHATAPETVTAWQKAFEGMKTDGTFKRIIQRWFPGLKPPKDARCPWLDNNR
ncbi:ABC transporter substrate-binding protein [Pseudodesulfovibrio indicus]|uniref:substrate-binding periplasmic protein n=1 Tax=Pseudodesulfovibrio indicus TaxID=1716143 RepID=UPI00292D4E17|nr:ABC transporter substrate-binding protein [Pseudodesulfovibrio indicus]